MHRWGSIFEKTYYVGGRNLKKEPLVRTNHGIYHPEQGYQRGPDKLSSQLRMMNAMNVTQNTNDWQNLFPNVCPVLDAALFPKNICV